LGVKLFKCVLSIKRRLFGVKHIFTADSWINLGLTYYAMGKYKDAICCYHSQHGCNASSYVQIKGRN